MCEVIGGPTAAQDILREAVVENGLVLPVALCRFCHFGSFRSLEGTSDRSYTVLRVNTRSIKKYGYEPLILLNS